MSPLLSRYESSEKGTDGAFDFSNLCFHMSSFLWLLGNCSPKQAVVAGTLVQ